MAAKINFLVQAILHKRPARRVACAVFLLLLILPACAPSPSEPVLFIPPTAPASPTLAATTVSLWTATPAVNLATATLQVAPAETGLPEATPISTVENCISDLKYLSDLTVPDGSPVGPGEKIDKQWRVLNSGTCNWADGYSLRLVDGFAPLGAELEQLLFPARAGSEATLQVFFVAPGEAGIYRSAWQAYDPEGQPFGEIVYIEFLVP